jgi:CoA:oxalate CoA-transferase
VAERLGIGYEELSALNPSLIYIAISGFGPSGPYRDLPAYDLVIQAMSGLGERQGTKEKPELVRSIVADKVSAMTAAYSAMAALYARTQSGKGQRVDVSMMDAFSAFILPDLLENRTFLPEEDDVLPFDRADLYRCWPTVDGHVAMLVVQDGQFAGLCKALNREDLIKDERTSSLGARITNATELFDILGEEILKWKTKELVARSREYGAPLAPVNTIDEFVADPATKAAGTVYEAEDPTAGTMRFVGSPVEFAETPMTMRAFPPQLGQNSDEVLKEAGFDEAEIAALRESGAVS